MALPNLDALLAPVSEDAPCGDDLEYDADFLALEQAARGKPEQSIGTSTIAAEEADWRDVAQRAIALFARTKDLRVAIHLTRAWVAQEGWAGFAHGLALLAQLLEQHWAGVYPVLDPDDDNDPTLRMNVLVALTDADGVLGALRRAPVAQSRRLGIFSVHDVVRSQSGSEGAPDAATLGGAWQDSGEEWQARLAKAVPEARSTLSAMEAFVAGQVGASQAPDLSALSRTLREAQLFITSHAAADAAPAGDDAQADGATDAGGPMVAGVPGPSGAIRSPTDVANTLDRICEYYARYEPSSPLPLLLKRARRLVGKDFMSIITDLAPDAMGQIENLRGAQGDGE